VRGVPRSDAARPRLSHFQRPAPHQLGVPGAAVLLASRRHRRRLPRSQVRIALRTHLAHWRVQRGARSLGSSYTSFPSLYKTTVYNSANLTVYRLCAVVSVTLKCDEPEVKKCRTRAAPLCDIFNRGLSYFNVTRTTMLNLFCRMTSH